MKAIITCVNYDDFLKVTLPAALPHFDEVIVLTSPKDRKTMEVCHRNGIDAIPTTAWYEKGNPFNKGRAVNEGLSMVAQDEWVLLLDADILLPFDFFESLASKSLSPDEIYGTDRYNVIGRQGLLTLQQYERPFKTIRDYAFPLVARHIQNNHPCPIGFFQLMIPNGKRYPMEIVDCGDGYPPVIEDASWTDVGFAMLWPIEKRVMLPGTGVYHLVSGVDPLGINWRGRKSLPF